jgi:hypothetical protein
MKKAILKTNNEGITVYPAKRVRSLPVRINLPIACDKLTK